MCMCRRKGYNVKTMQIGGCFPGVLGTYVRLDHLKKGVGASTGVGVNTGLYGKSIVLWNAVA